MDFDPRSDIETGGRARSAPGRLRLLFVERHDVLRRTVARSIEVVFGNVDVVAVDTAADALQLAARLDFHLFLLDVDLSDDHGVVLAARLRELQPAAALVILATQEADRLRAALAPLAPSAFVDKHELNGMLLARLAEALARFGLPLRSAA